MSTNTTRTPPQEPQKSVLDLGFLSKILEALLFSASKPLTLEELKDATGDYEAKDIKDALARLNDEYKNAERSFTILEVAHGWQMVTLPNYAEYIKRLYMKSTAQKLSRSTVEALAIIAYRQPVTRQEIEFIRGVNTEGVLKSLLEKDLARIMGRKDAPGRPILYGTTRKFLEHFGLRSLEDLPKIEELNLAAHEHTASPAIDATPTPAAAVPDEGATQEPGPRADKDPGVSS